MRFFEKFEIAAYKLLREDGRQSEMRDIVEYIICGVIILNVIFLILESVDVSDKYSHVRVIVNICFFMFFVIEYLLRVMIADITMRDRKHPIKSRIRYMLSFRALVDLLALMPVGFMAVDFRIFRMLRLLKISRLKSLRQYTEVMVRVLKTKLAQLLSSLFIAFIFILTCAVIIYNLEHDAQPAVFESILSGLWWSVSAITTVGYGDIYPITPMGQILSSFVAVFGVLFMAFPVAILTSGFIEISKKNENE